MYFFSSRRRHTRWPRDWSSDVCSSDLEIADHYFALEELSYDLGSYMNEQQYDPDQLNEIEARLDEINRLKKKYGPTVNDMFKYAAEIDEEIEDRKSVV